VTKRLSKEGVEREIAALDTLDNKALQDKWAALYGRDPPRRIRAGLLRLGIAYRLQERAFGGLTPKTIRYLQKLAAELRAARATAETQVDAEVPVRPSVVQTLTLTPGTRLMREWNGTTEVVDVVADGLVWRGATYRTLSAVAVAITGTKWSGPKFFGLTLPRQRLRGPRVGSQAEHAAEVS
jgi:hypothetical protein